mmetsp:Transcript_5507/g.12001  ORF Transcript_5507/g.12001 Transcript_5507/m.12001 type:complete len:236 (-) Transcript_5507:517-1224(-)
MLEHIRYVRRYAEDVSRVADVLGGKAGGEGRTVSVVGPYEAVVGRNEEVPVPVEVAGDDIPGARLDVLSTDLGGGRPDVPLLLDPLVVVVVGNGIPVIVVAAASVGIGLDGLALRTGRLFGAGLCLGAGLCPGTGPATRGRSRRPLLRLDLDVSWSGSGRGIATPLAGPCRCSRCGPLAALSLAVLPVGPVAVGGVPGRVSKGRPAAPPGCLSVLVILHGRIAVVGSRGSSRSSG